jgi:signal transduction histidine kinase
MNYSITGCLNYLNTVKIMTMHYLKKTTVLSVLLMLNSMLYSQHKVTFKVSQPNAVTYDSIYITGTFNNYSWEADLKYLLTSSSSNEWSITLDVKGGSNEIYFHKGSYGTEATTVEGYKLKGCKINIQKDTVIHYVIEAWKDRLPFMPVLTIAESIINENKGIPLSDLNCWYFKKGNSVPGVGQNSIDTSAWVKFRPADIDKSLADNNGRREGWFKTYIKVDSSMMYKPIHFKFGLFGAGALYIDGKLIQTYGVAGKDKKGYREFTPNHRVPIQFTLDTAGVHELSLHIVDYLVPLENEKYSKGWFVGIWDKTTADEYAKHVEEEPFFNTLWLTVGALLCILFWALAFQNRDEKNLRLIAITSTSLLALSITVWMPHNAFASFFLMIITNEYLSVIAMKFFFVSSILLVVNIFKRKITWILKLIFGLYLVSTVIDFIYPDSFWFMSITYFALAFIINIYYVISSWKSLKGAQWFIVAGVLLTYLLITTLLSIGFLRTDLLQQTLLGLLFTGIFLSLPISLLFFISFRFKEFIKDVQFNAQQVVQLSEEKKLQAVAQQKLLELEVERQTLELRTSIETLKATQFQLVQSEKMASLGELTAGIAHEIQNPLNFVNNFSEVNSELIAEMKDALNKGNVEEAKNIADDINDNEQKIIFHGKRADGIVKGMLQHSRSNSGVKEPTAINALADEYLRLAYHGLRAKDKTFNATMKTNYDESIGKINIIPQDMGRVILNLITNAFYATSERKKMEGGSYEPTVSVSTKKMIDKVFITVTDNGNGIPQKIIDKIFQPFFTTKPSGEGTGLGLSLSYDIVKAHQGELSVVSNEEEGTTFQIILPL